MDAKASAGRGGGGSRRKRDAPAVLHNADGGSHAAGSAQDEALELLRADPAALEGVGETGLTLLDVQVSLDESTVVELLACDADGTPVLVLCCGDDEGAALGRIGRVMGAFRRGGPLLELAFGERGLDASVPPRVLLLAPRFSDDLPGQLDLLGEVSVSALEYSIVRPRGIEPLLHVTRLHRTGGRAGGARRVAGPRAAANGSKAAEIPAELEGEPDELTASELEPLSPDDLDGLLDRAHQSIASLSDKVTAAEEDDRIRFLVDGRPLASLLLDASAGTLTLTIDEEGGVVDTLTIADEAGLHEALNALFDRYFQELDAPL